MTTRLSIDRDDIEQAIEIACGDTIGREIMSSRTASQRDIDRFRARLRRFLAELPGDTSTSELSEAMEQ
jgi:hypothetical protein